MFVARIRDSVIAYLPHGQLRDRRGPERMDGLRHDLPRARPRHWRVGRLPRILVTDLVVQ